MGVAIWATAAGCALFAGAAVAQQRQAPLFYDSRRLPDMEVERRNQEVLQEQRRVADERRLDAEANAKRLADDKKLAAEQERKALDDKKRAEDVRIAAEAEAKKKAEDARLAALEVQRKADEEKRIAAEAEAKKKSDDARLAALEGQRKADEEKRIAAETEAKKKAEETRLAALEVQRKADEVKRIAAEAEAKKKAEETRLAALAVQRKADEEKNIAAEAEAKKKAEEARLAALEVQRKADEEKRIAAEAEAKKKAETARLAALEAQRKADDDKKRVAEAEARKKSEEARIAAELARKAEDEKRLAAATPNAAPLAAAALVEPPRTVPPTKTAVLAPQITNSINPAVVAGGPCDKPTPRTSALAGGRMEIVIDSPCRRGQSFNLSYGSHDFVRKLDGTGRVTLVMDLFLGKAEPVRFTYADGKTDSVAAAATDLGEVSKVALIWDSPVDLDLHALENGAGIGKTGNLWSGSTPTGDAAKALMTEGGRGAGFLSTIDDGTHEGPKLEVYTYFHHPEQDSGAVVMALDYASRGSKPSGEMCGQGALAEIPFEVVSLNPRGAVRLESGLIPAAKCGETLAGSTRYLQGAVPDLRFRR